MSLIDELSKQILPIDLREKAIKSAHDLVDRLLV